VLLGVLALRLVRADQPIVENYVGRQIPTAMVARNLERGQSWLRPALDTGPFPNLFLVEPPIYEAVVLEIRRFLNIALEPAGRITSALALTLGAWGLYGLTRRREGPHVALLSVVIFGLLPVTIRYGRAFQPDPFVLGTLIASLYCWDEHQHAGGAGWLACGWILLAVGLAQKVIAAYFLVPLIAIVLDARSPNPTAADRPGQFAKWRWLLVLLALTLLPAVAWYWHASRLLTLDGGSRASAENAAIWQSVLIPSALVRAETYRIIARFLLFRAFTPIGFALAVCGSVGAGKDRLWLWWSIGAVAALLVLSAKIHHEYYWLALSPLISVGIARALARLWSLGSAERRWVKHAVFGPIVCALAVSAFVALSVRQSASTWRTPTEWSHLAEAAVDVRAIVRPDQLVAATEALLYAADRRGGRWEPDPESARRAAREWGNTLTDDGPLALLECYRLHRIEFFADTGSEDDPRVRSLREAVRARYLVLVDRPEVFIASLTPPAGGGAEHGRR
jgi:hypothetical protein